MQQAKRALAESESGLLSGLPHHASVVGKQTLVEYELQGLGASYSTALGEQTLMQDSSTPNATSPNELPFQAEARTLLGALLQPLAKSPTLPIDDSALPDDIRAELESATGQSLSHVNVHAGARGHAVAASHGARAVAIDSDIYVAKGQLDTTTTEGRELLAHEVAHTVQARNTPQPATYPVAAPRNRDAVIAAAEAEADHFAARFRVGGGAARFSPKVAVAGVALLAPEPGAAHARADIASNAALGQHAGGNSQHTPGSEDDAATAPPDPGAVKPGSSTTPREPRSITNRLPSAARRYAALPYHRLRVIDQSARDRDALLLAARELVWLVGCTLGHTNTSQRPQRTLTPVSGRYVRVDQRHLDVLASAHPREEVGVLKHKADGLVPDPREVIARQFGDILPIQHVTAVSWAIEAPDYIHQRRLARSGGAHDGDELARRDLERNVVKSDYLNLAHAINFATCSSSISITAPRC